MSLCCLQPFKRGDSFGLAGRGLLVAGTWTATAKGRSLETGAFIDEFVVSLQPTGEPPVMQPNGSLRYPHWLSIQKDKAATLLWPVNFDLAIDVRFMDAGGIARSTRTFTRRVIRGETNEASA